MAQKTVLASYIDTAGSKANLDNACKRLLANKIILAWIMKCTMKEYQNYSVQEIAGKFIEEDPVISRIAVHSDEMDIDSLKANDVCPSEQINFNEYGSVYSGATEDSTMTEGTVTFDIRFRAIIPHNGETVTLIINVEAQNNFYPGYPLIKRGIYYCCRMISAQYGTEFQDSHYEKIRKVYSIWICINPPKNKQNTITKYELTEKNLIGNAKEELTHYDLLAAVMICLKPPTKEDTEKGIIDLLSVLLSSNIETEDKKKILEKDYGISMEIEREEVASMCNYSDYIENKGISEGENLMAQLINHLLSDNRIEDIRLAAIDDNARKNLYSEYGIIYDIHDMKKANRAKYI